MIDLTGKKFGKLKVIKRVGFDKKGNTMWLCKCDCGNEKSIRGYNLTSGHTKSCGCLHELILYPKLSPGLANMRIAIREYKKGAQKKGIEYNLVEEQFREITQKDCYYCGAKPNNIRNSTGLNRSYKYNGIDRIDNNKGYTMDNIVPCCKTCNAAKGILTTQEFKNWVIRIHNNLIIKKGE